MIRLYLTLICFMLIIFTLLTTLARTLGATQPPNPALVDFGYCSGAPCYLGIDMQTNDMNAADARLTAAGYYGNIGSGFYSSLDNRCNVYLTPDIYGDEVISGVKLSNCHGLLLGDFISIFGVPDRLVADSLCNWILEYPQHVIVYIEGRIASPSGIVSLLSSHRITQIDFNREFTLLSSAQWRGFAPLWRYRQYEPEVSFGTRCD
jgi:hypothetical protein